MDGVSASRAEQRPYDALVSGAGLVGSAVALGLARMGQRVALIEPHAPAPVSAPEHDRRTLV